MYTTIRITEENGKKLQELKKQQKLKTVDEVIEDLLSAREGLIPAETVKNEIKNLLEILK